MPSPTVRALFSKPKHGAPMFPQLQLSLKVRQGIEEDINANPQSPRQVLVMRQEELQAFSIAPGCLRENIVVSGLNADEFVPGSALEFRSGAVIRLTFYCEPCKQVAPFVTPLKRIERKRGILGVIQSGGTISIGDTVAIQPHVFPPLSDIPYERFLFFVGHIPQGKVVTYRQTLTGIGVSRSYFRVLPLYLRKAAKTDAPIHRVLDSQGCLVAHIPNQQRLLESEGIQVKHSPDDLCEGQVNQRLSVCLRQYSWDCLLF